MKKRLFVLLTVLLLVATGCSTKKDERPVAAKPTAAPTAAPTAVPDMPIADGVVHTSGDGMWKYVRLTTRTIEICSYNGGGSELTIPGEIDGYTVVSIGDKAFSREYSLTKVFIPDSVISIGENPFVDCSKLTVISVSADNPVFASINGVLFNKKEKELISYPCGLSGRTYEIPQGIKSIGNCAFSYCDNLTTIIIPDSVTSIGDYAFEWSTSLAKINIPASVTHIGKNPFRYCGDLSSFGLSDNHPIYEVIDHALFNKAKKELICYPKYYGGYIIARVEKYTIPQGTLSIGDSAFYYCKSLTSITIPASVTFIGDNAFYECNSLKYMTIPYGVTSIGNSTFSGCSAMTGVSIPDTVTSIGDEAFYWCTHLNSVTIPNTVTSIGDSAFQGCDRLTSITIPNSVVSIGHNPFEWCDRLTSINVRSDHPVLQVVDGVLFNKVEKKLICYPQAFKDSGYIVPQGTRIIGGYAFSTCTSLGIITVPDSVISIEGGAFRDCRIKTFSVTRNSYAEQYCKDGNRDYVYTESTDWLTN